MAMIIRILNLAFLALALLTVPVRADEIDRIASYVGSWRGEGQLVGGEDPESFRCRMTVSRGSQAKINYAGRCTLVNMNLSVSGTIAYDDASRTYQAIMGSNAGFKGVAIGRVKGGTITFDLAEKEEDRAGNAVRLGAQIVLINNTSITVNYQVEFNDSGKVLTATVPFAK